jgi:hypothetical protein
VITVLLSSLEHVVEASDLRRRWRRAPIADPGSPRDTEAEFAEQKRRILGF